MTDGQYHIEPVSGIPVVTVPEEIDVTNAADLRAALLKAGVNGSGMLVADMTQTQFCDSSGVHALVAAHRRAQAEGGQLLLVISSAAVLRILAITGIDRVIPNFTSLADALAHAYNGHARTASNAVSNAVSNLISNPDADPGRAPVA